MKKNKRYGAIAFYPKRNFWKPARPRNYYLTLSLPMYHR